jgi:anti-anti-sigma regulatory factor
MPTIAVLHKVEGEHVVQTLREAGEKVETANGEMILDFSAVRRVEPSAVIALEELAAVAEQKHVKLTLRGVNVDVYKVLKLVKLAPRFTFLN